MITTERLIIRKIKGTDLPALYAMYCTDHVRRYNMMEDRSFEEFSEYYLSMEEKETYFIEVIDTGDVIGEISFNDDRLRFNVNSKVVSYWQGEQYGGKGYMAEALGALIEDGFEKGKYDILSARVFGGNDASMHLLKKLRFEQEGFLKKAVKNFDGIIFDDALFVRFK